MGGEVKVERVRAVVHGRVQGIGYRWFVRDTASDLRLSGWVRNLQDGSVELEAEGPAGDLERLQAALRTGHPYARVDRVESSRVEPRGKKGTFDIVI
ncbi:MAG: acylphosphatase [Elusimicrobia bacterium]|nr:acylphosphatase [Elusimicrobiota bacterium]